MFCHNCGSEVHDFAETCFKCKSKLILPIKAVPVENIEKPKTSKISPVTGYILGFLMPFLGLIIGIYFLFCKNRADHGILVICWSIFWWIVSFICLYLLLTEALV